jgi:hypothetical protein
MADLEGNQAGGRAGAREVDRGHTPAPELALEHVALG